MNVNYNNIYSDYIGATGAYSISDYIDITSNILDNKINITSNILKLYTDTNITNLDNKYKILIDQKTIIETYNNINYNVKHTYISNSNIDNIYSEIRFYSKNAINYPTYEITESPLHKVKIGNDGCLYIWYSYNPFISLTLPSQWIDINKEIGKQQADGLNQGAAIIAAENQIILINSTLTALSGEITSLYALSSGGSGTGGLSASPYNVPRLDNGIITTEAIDSIRNNLLIRGQTVQNYIANLGGATGFLAVIYGIAEGFGRTRYTNTMMDQLRSNLNSNLAIGNIENANIISNTINYTSNNYLTSNLKDIYENYSNLGIIQGFINSNIQTQQYISNLNTNELKINNNNISNIYVASNVLSNLNINFGFINSNIQTQQIISNLKCENFFLSNLNNIHTSNLTTSNIVKDIVLNEMPRVNKKSAFYCQTTNLIYPDGVKAFYSYHLYLPDYVATGIIDIGSGSGDTYRIFKIKCFFGSSYFQKLTNGIPDIVEYNIYMSNKANAGGDGTIAGVNIMATGIPQNYYLNNLMNNNLFILRNNTSSSSFNFNYLSILTTQIADVRCIIQDLLN